MSVSSKKTLVCNVVIAFRGSPLKMFVCRKSTDERCRMDLTLMSGWCVLKVSITRRMLLWVRSAWGPSSQCLPVLTYAVASSKRKSAFSMFPQRGDWKGGSVRVDAF